VLLYVTAGVLSLAAVGITIFHSYLNHGHGLWILSLQLLAFGFLVYSFYGAVTRRKADSKKAVAILGRGDTLDYLMDNMPCALTAIGPSFVILWANRQVAAFTGRDPEELVGKRCYDSFGEGEVCFGCPVREAFATKQVCRNFKSENTLSGERIGIEQTAIPVLKQDGEVKYVVEIVLDETKKMKLEKENKELFIQTVSALAGLIDKRDIATGKHSMAVRDIAVSIGQELALAPTVLEEISVAALLHDIGKIGIPESILNKPGKLSPEEYDVIRSHSELGYNTIKIVKPLERIAEYVRCHHERFDGQGYPAGKKGDEIPLVAKILCVADVYEAITSHRVYRPAMDTQQALSLMYEGRGSMFDPLVLNAFMDMLVKRDPTLAAVVAKVKKTME